MMTDERKTELYAALVKEAEMITADGLTPSRFEMLKILTDEMDVELNRDAVNLIEKLYRDGFCGA
jgi:pyridoxal/pyridoxine/pyridoxamine kinase